MAYKVIQIIWLIQGKNPEKYQNLEEFFRFSLARNKQDNLKWFLFWDFTPSKPFPKSPRSHTSDWDDFLPFLGGP